MEEVPFLGGEKQQYAELLAAFDAPAFVRRARGVEAAYERLLRDCRRQRDEWLTMVKVRLATLRARAGSWEALRGLANVEALEAMERELSPRLRAAVAVSTSPAVLRREVGRLAESVERFNRRWLAWLPEQDIATVNRLRDGFNRWYVIEKACAMRNDVLARVGFEPLPMMDHDELLRLMPPLPDVRAG
jgi:hypothetical protein